MLTDGDMATYSCWYILFKWKKMMIIIKSLQIRKPHPWEDYFTEMETGKELPKHSLTPRRKKVDTGILKLEDPTG